MRPAAGCYVACQGILARFHGLPVHRCSCNSSILTRWVARPDLGCPPPPSRSGTLSTRHFSPCPKSLLHATCPRQTPENVAARVRRTNSRWGQPIEWTAWQNTHLSTQNATCGARLLGHFVSPGFFSTMRFNGRKHRRMGVHFGPQEPRFERTSSSITGSVGMHSFLH